MNASRHCAVLLLAVAATAASAGEDAAQRLAAARTELLAEFTPPRPPDPGAAAWAAQLDRERAALATLRSVETLFALSLDGKPAPAGIRLRAWHDGLDIATDTTETDAAGSAKLQLPPGEWWVVVAGELGRDTVAFGSTRIDIAAAGDVALALDTPCVVRFRRRGGQPATPERVVLATEDHRHRIDIVPKRGRLVIRRPTATPFVVQAVLAPGTQSGYLVRTTVDGAERDVAPAAERSTLLTFDGAPRHVLHADLGPTDVLRFPFEVETRRRVVMHVSGVPELGVSYDVTRTQGKHAFYASPLAMDGTPRTFRGRPPFDVSIGYRHNTSSRFRDRRNTVSLRVFLREENGLIMRGYDRDNPFPVDWVARVGDSTLSSGTMNGAWRARLPKMAREQLGELRFDVTAPAAGLARRREIVPLATSEVARVGELRVFACPQLAANAGAWARWAGDLVAAFKDARHVRPARIDVLMWIDTMPRLSGWGGWRGNNSHAQFTDSRLFGWTWAPAKNDGTVSHEMTHAFHRHAHDAGFQRIQSRAVNRMRTLRRDVHRVPAGNEHRALLATLPEQLPIAQNGPFPASGAAAAVRKGLGEDPFVVWYLRRTKGGGAVVDRRRNAERYAYWLTCAGFSADEARAGVLSFFAEENVAWLMRLRGGDVSDDRAEAARRALSDDRLAKPRIEDRGKVAARWRAFDPGAAEAIDAALARMVREVGTWQVRADVRLAVARHAVASGDRAAVKSHLLEALADAWRTGRDGFDATLTTAVEILAATPD